MTVETPGPEPAKRQRDRLIRLIPGRMRPGYPPELAADAGRIASVVEAFLTAEGAEDDTGR